MNDVNFKVINNYREVISEGTEEDDTTVVDTCASCQDCQFSIFTKANKVNELMCLEGDLPVHVNGICNLYVPVI